MVVTARVAVVWSVAQKRAVWPGVQPSHQVKVHMLSSQPLHFHIDIARNILVSFVMLRNSQCHYCSTL